MKHGFEQIAVLVGFVTEYVDNLCHAATVVDTRHVHDDVNRQGYGLTNAVMREANVGCEHTVCETR